ncbi:hypothetical protein AB1Y20_017149 [Prymnesium parvum]|uniref:Nuclear speckle splicing regulatory protein 1 N-terminal domain-containing protein n=1 Tax=Prymnesium parvum TaxID=97485 RepID=A0AB34ICI3_PRYPA
MAEKRAYGLSGPAGLQIKPKAKLPRPKPSCGFVEEAEEEEGAKAVVRRMMQGHEGKRAVEMQRQKALAEDESIYDYDGVYDEMQERGGEAQRTKINHRVVVGRPKEEKKARYIGSIMEAHKVREIENEKLFERKMVREAEAEAHLYADKEKFLTSAYRKKLAAREEYEAELKRKEVIEAREDVTKRADLSGFYSNLLHHSLAGNDAAASTAAVDKALAGMKGHARPHEGGGAAGTSSSAAEEFEAPPPPAAAPLVDASLASAIAAATSVEAPRAIDKPPEPPTTVSHARRNDGDAVMSARERYLARKAHKSTG